MSEKELDPYVAGLPRTRGAACALLLDPHDRILIVKPTYRPGWLLPGGVIEADESPFAACRRELREELGVTVALDALVAIDWIPPRENRDASNIFVFGGRLDPGTASEIRLPLDELAEYAMVTVSELSPLFVERVVRRITACAQAFKRGRTVYLESGIEFQHLTIRLR